MEFSCEGIAVISDMIDNLAADIADTVAGLAPRSFNCCDDKPYGSKENREWECEWKNGALDPDGKPGDTGCIQELVGRRSSHVGTEGQTLEYCVLYVESGPGEAHLSWHTREELIRVYGWGLVGEQTDEFNAEMHRVDSMTDAERIASYKDAVARCERIYEDDPEMEYEDCPFYAQAVTVQDVQAGLGLHVGRQLHKGLLKARHDAMITHTAATEQEREEGTRPKTDTQKAGLLFNVGHAGQLLARRCGRTVELGAALTLASALETIAGDLIDLTFKQLPSPDRLITPRHVMLAVRRDAELQQMFGHMVILGGGEAPLRDERLSGPWPIRENDPLIETQGCRHLRYITGEPVASCLHGSHNPSGLRGNLDSDGYIQTIGPGLYAKVVRVLDEDNLSALSPDALESELGCRGLSLDGSKVDQLARLEQALRREQCLEYIEVGRLHGLSDPLEILPHTICRHDPDELSSAEQEAATGPSYPTPIPDPSHRIGVYDNPDGEALVDAARKMNTRVVLRERFIREFAARAGVLALKDDAYETIRRCLDRFLGTLVQKATRRMENRRSCALAAGDLAASLKDMGMVVVGLGLGRNRITERIRDGENLLATDLSTGPLQQCEAERWAFTPIDEMLHKSAVQELQTEANKLQLVDEFKALLYGADAGQFQRNCNRHPGITAPVQHPIRQSAHERAESAIRSAQLQGGHIIPFLLFFRWYKSLMKMHKWCSRADAAAVTLANAAVEKYAVDLLAYANRIASVGQRSFVTAADVECASEATIRAASRWRA